MYLAIINELTNLVVNVVQLVEDGQDWEPPVDHISVETTEGAIGDTYTNGTFIKPEQPPLSVKPILSISKRQLLIALVNNNFISDQEAIDAATSGAIPLSMQGLIVSMADKVTWAAMTVIERDHPLVQAFAQGANLDEETLIAFFNQASTL